MDLGTMKKNRWKKRLVLSTLESTNGMDMTMMGMDKIRMPGDTWIRLGLKMYPTNLTCT